MVTYTMYPVLQLYIAIAVFTVLVTISLFKVKGFIKNLVSVLLISIMLFHYLIVYTLLEYIDVDLYPLIIVEKTQHGSTLYLDLGQISAITLLLTWRREVVNLVTKISRRITRGECIRDK